MGASEASVVKAGSSVILETCHHRVEKFCSVGDQVIVEFNGQRFFTKIRGIKADFVMRETSGSGKSKLAVIHESSYMLTDLTKKIASAGVGLNARFIVRFIVDGMVFSFNSFVHAVHARPPMLALDYPDRLERRNMRATERINTLIPMTFFHPGSKAQISGAVLDISDLGARLGIQKSDAITEQEKISVSLTLPTGQALEGSEMIVQNVNSEGDKYFLGAKFAAHESLVASFFNECTHALVKYA